MTANRLLDDKVIIVTGAGSGIGAASVTAFSQAGATVIACDKSSVVEHVATRVVHNGGRADALVMDAGREEDVAGAVADAVRRYGALDGFFANAGITGGAVGGFFDSSPDAWAEVLRVNLIGTFLAIKHAAPEIRKRGGGSIVATASVAGMRANAGPAHYSASKAGVINLVQTAAYNLYGTNVRVNALCPGLIETPMTQSFYDYARITNTLDKLGSLNPMTRGGRPDEVAQAALFLFSDMSSYVNGQALPVDGGLSSSHPYGQRPDYAAMKATIDAAEKSSGNQ